jgi:hypothetical protein
VSVPAERRDAVERAALAFALALFRANPGAK